MLGIGKYDNKDINDLIGMNNDYKNMKLAFNYHFGYSMFYRTENSDDHDIKQCDKKCATISDCHDSFKIHWTEDEVLDFVEDIQDYLMKNGEYFDGLIFIISSNAHEKHENREILASDSIPIQLASIFYEFNSKNCPSLANDPKIFFIDSRKGSKTSIANSNVNNKNNTLGIEKLLDKSLQGVGEDGSMHISFGNNNNSEMYISDESLMFHTEQEFRYIFANADGYVASDNKENGGFLIESIKDIFCDPNVGSHDFDQIMRQIRKRVEEKTSNINPLGPQNVQEVVNSNFKITFAKNVNNESN